MLSSFPTKSQMTSWSLVVPPSCSGRLISPLRRCFMPRFGHLRVFPASMEAARGVFGGLVAEVVPEGMPTTVGGGAGSVHTLCSLRLPACAAGHNHPPQRPYSPHSLPRPAYGDLGPLAYGREEAESKIECLKLLPYTWRQCFNLKPRPFWLASLLLASLTAAAFVRPDPQMYSPVASLRRLTTGHLTFTVPRKVK